MEIKLTAVFWGELLLIALAIFITGDRLEEYNETNTAYVRTAAIG